MTAEKRQKSMSIVRMVVSLGIIASMAAVILALVYNVTKQPIADAAAREQVDAVKAVTPSFNNNPVADTIRVAVPGESESLLVFPAYDNGCFVGAAVESYSNDGFSGPIKVMVGFDADGNVVDYRVLSHGETPGLGAKMEEWFRDPAEKRSILGLNPATTSFYVTKDQQQGGEIDGITAATISSRAFLDAVRRAYSAFTQIDKN